MSIRATARAPLGLLLAGALVTVWLLADPRTPDLAAAVYRVDLFGRVGFAVWDERWYAGHALPGYSLLFPALGSLLGVRLLGALSVLASATLFEALVRRGYGPAARWGAALFAVAAVGDVWSGRLAFALGVPFALAAVLVLVPALPPVAAGRSESASGARDERLSLRRGMAAGALALLCAAASPVAGALLALAGLTYALWAGRRSGAPARRRHAVGVALVLVLAPAVLVLALVALFPEGGTEPYPILSFAATALALGAFVWALPASEPLLRFGAAVYLLACLACLLVHSPVGSNVERYGVLLAGPLLACARRSRVDMRSAVALVVIMTWVVWGPVRETRAVAGNESTSAAYYRPLERFLAGVGAPPAQPLRVEVPLTRSHWEAALLAPSVSLARGWEKQLDSRYDQVLLTPGLTAAAYDRWLHQQAVAYVALPDTPLDPSSAQEGRLIAAGLPYLRLVFASRHWRVYRVLDPTPLASGPGTLTSMGDDSFALRARSPGSFDVRVHYSRYLTLVRGSGCVGRAPGGWTDVMLDRPGPAVVTASFSLARAFASGPACSAGAGAGGVGTSAVASVTGHAATAPTTASHGGIAPASGPALPYRWFVATTGAPASIAVENRATGTTAWRLPGPSDEIGGQAHGAIAGYVSSQAIAPGQAESVYVDAPGSRTVTVDVYRMGWYGGRGGRLVLASRPLRASRQPRCTHRLMTGLTECRWRATLTFPIIKTLTSGVYIVKLRGSSGAQSDCLFLLRPASPPPLLVEIPTATYEAYNAWGGDSLYPGGSKRVGVTGTDQGVEVSYDRPYESQTGAGQFFIRDVAMVRFLERYGYPVGYTTIESIDGDPGQLDGARAVIDVGHSEYWSQRDEHAFAAARDRGTSLLFISSDTMAWRVRFAPATAASSQAGQPDHRIVAYKEHAALDPDQADATGVFPGGGAALVGSAYDGCITPRVQVPGPPIYRYYSWTPSPDLQPGWLFARTGITADASIRGIVGYELDERTPVTPPGTLLIGTGARVPCGSEAEPSPAHGALAETTLYTARSGALVFATGTLGWMYALSPVPQASPDAPLAPDPRVVAMTRNLLARVLGRRP